MKDQHKQIKGYRDLSQQEIDLMNKAKEKAEEVKVIVEEILDLRNNQQLKLFAFEPTDGVQGLDEDQIFESFENINNAEARLKEGFMWLVRSIALPSTF